MKMIDIGRVAELTGLTTATIRYYESKRPDHACRAQGPDPHL